MKSLVMLAALAAAFPVAAQAAPAKESEHAGHTTPAPAPTPAPTKGAADHTGHAGHGSGEHSNDCACCKNKASPQAKCPDKPAAPAQPGNGAHEHN